MQLITTVLAVTFFAACTSAQNNAAKSTPTIMEANTQTNSIHRFQLESIDGGKLNFADFKGKKILIVNTASACGYTKQYEGLEKLYAAHKDKLVVVGVPANNFGGQEPGTNEEISSFCKKNYGVTFPLSAKMDVIGDQQVPLFSWLTSKEKNGVLDATIKWNFNKFLLDEQGNLVAYFPSKTEPMSEEILNYIK